MFMSAFLLRAFLPHLATHKWPLKSTQPRTITISILLPQQHLPPLRHSRRPSLTSVSFPSASPKSKFDDFTTVSKKKKGKKEDPAAAPVPGAEPAKAPEPKLTQEDLFGSGNGKRVSAEEGDGQTGKGRAIHCWECRKGERCQRRSVGG